MTSTNNSIGQIMVGQIFSTKTCEKIHRPNELSATSFIGQMSFGNKVHWQNERQPKEFYTK